MGAASTLVVLLIAVLFSMATVTSATAAATIRMLVAYCPTDFTGAGAIVEVDPLTGSWKILNHIKFPSDIFGCIADYDPTYDFDPANPHLLWFDFTDEAGYFVSINMETAEISHFASSDMFFTGFINFQQFAKQSELRGLTPSVSQSGFCSDGCMQYGIQAIAPPHKYTPKEFIPFKAALDDTDFVDFEKNVFYFQGSYDLREKTCGPSDYSECLVSVDGTTGALLNAIYTPDYTVYKFARQAHKNSHGDATVLAWMEGFDKLCKHPEENYLFGEVTLRTAKAVPIACIERNETVHMDEWIASFSTDGSLFATASGDAEGTDPQFLSFSPKTGKTIVDSKLAGLAKALGADMKLIWVWALEFY